MKTAVERLQEGILTCPLCRRALSVLIGPGFLNFRCAGLHAFEGRELLSAYSRELDVVLLSALRAWEDQAFSLRELAAETRRHGHARIAERFESDARCLEEHVERIAEGLVTEGPSAPLEEQGWRVFDRIPPGSGPRLV